MGRQPRRDLDAEINGFMRVAKSFLESAENQVKQLADKGDCDYESLGDAANKIKRLIKECSNTLSTKTPRGNENDADTASVKSAAGRLDAEFEKKKNHVHLKEPPIYVDGRNGSFINPSELDKTVEFPCRRNCRGRGSTRSC